jgi:hypothetical protein
MEHQATRFPRAITWVLTALLAIAVLSNVAFWFRGSFAKHWAVPHAIYSTGSLVNSYHTHKSKTGKWPEPGEFAAKDVEFVRSYEDRGVRVDVFNFGGGQYALIYVHEHSLEVFPVSSVPTTRPSGAAQ